MNPLTHIHPQLVYIVAHQHSPVLRRVRTLVDLLSYGLAESRLLREPLARRSGDGMPSQLHGAGLAVDFDIGGWDHVCFLAKAEFVLNFERAFEKIIFSLLPLG